MSQLGFDRAGFPNIVCAVDGIHIPIMRPHCDNPLAYFNRKQFYFVNLAGFCDSQRQFCHSHPGSWHDAWAFCLAEVACLLEEDPLMECTSLEILPFVAPTNETIQA